ncbi:hypothetical protein [Yinghuangia soli]|uniref:Uncharacterized protein n=1 Tax=Yinghuangia soli TaxID=2908204 RepID=A0AA41PW43_9ACTN|nr:hypothetical protein [Yinghuangia soli]MCF2526796.1 hypothetical protein [Yinghuangia soli]
MGIDITGYIERLTPYGGNDGDTPSWDSVIALSELYLGRDYDAFGCLFGVANHARFRPVAAERGLPADTSSAVRAIYDRDRGYGAASAFSATWVGWPELRDIDWEEPAEGVDARVTEYVRTETGLRPLGKAAWSRAVADSLGTGFGGSYADRLPREETEWTHGDMVFRTVLMRRRDAIPAGSEWQPVWDVMRALAQVHGDDGVRLVVWFHR